MPGPPEMIWVILLFVLLFGAKKLPELARSAGESLKEFKKATKEAMEEDQTPTPVQAESRRLEASAADEVTSSTIS